MTTSDDENVYNCNQAIVFPSTYKLYNTVTSTYVVQTLLKTFIIPKLQDDVSQVSGSYFILVADTEIRGYSILIQALEDTNTEVLFHRIMVR